MNQARIRLLGADQLPEGFGELADLEIEFVPPRNKNGPTLSACPSPETVDVYLIGPTDDTSAIPDQGQVIYLLPPGTPIPESLAPDTADFAWITASRDELLARVRSRAVMATVQDIWSKTDPMTMVLNRRAFRSALDRLEEQEAALLLLDIDEFKRINDENGFRDGDEVIVLLAQRIRQQLSKNQPFARLSGGMFGILLPNDTESRGLRLAQTLCELVAHAPFRTRDGREISVKISAGVAANIPGEKDSDNLTQVLPMSPGDHSELWHKAFSALRNAKVGGRNRAAGFNLDIKRSSAATSFERKILEDITALATQRATATITSEGEKMLRLVEDRHRDAERRASMDALTQLGNRAAFESFLPQRFAAARAQHTPLSLLLLDVDDFGRYNKQFGWPTGDRVLKHLGRIIRDHTRATDLAARYGGDEFVVVMPSTSESAAMRVAHRIVGAARANPIEVDSVVVTISVGVSVMLPSDTTPWDLLARASDALLKAKSEGGNRAVTPITVELAADTVAIPLGDGRPDLASLPLGLPAALPSSPVTPELIVARL